MIPKKKFNLSRDLTEIQNCVLISFAKRERIEQEKRTNPQFGKNRETKNSCSNGLLNFFSRLWQFNQTYVHCEISLITNENLCITYAVFSDKGEKAVTKLNREFNKLYDHVYIGIDSESKRKIYNFLEKQIDKSYDFYGAITSTFYTGKFNCNRKNWHCCALVICSLKKAGILKYVRPDCVEIDELYTLLKSREDKVGRCVPYEQKKIQRDFFDLVGLDFDV